MKHFTIAEEFLTSVADVKEVYFDGKSHKAYGTKDHPEFNKLRISLFNDGFIKIEKGWWNGDRVLKPFTLNGYEFNINEQFPCAAAMKFRIKNEN